MKTILILLAVSFSCSTLFARSNVEKKLGSLREKSEIYVYLAAGTNMDSLKKVVPSSAKIVKYHKQIAVIRFEKPFEASVLKSVRSVPGVLEASRNKTMVPLQEGNVDPNCCGKTNVEPSIQDVVDQVQKVKSSMDGGKTCLKADNCSQITPGEKLWAQKKVDGPAMQNLLKQWGLDNPAQKVKVAILDTGFDVNGFASRGLFAPNAKYAVQAGFPEAGDPARDETGHGTPIFSLFMGKDIGLAPNTDITAMRVVKKGVNGGTSSAAINASVLTACEQGNRIIVLSWGDDSEEKGESDFFSDDIKKTLSEKNCSVVRAAGNSSRRDVKRKGGIDDADLTVSAIDTSGKFSEFSSNGEVAAPGKNIFAYPTSDSDSRAFSFLCDGSPGSLINGTSFAGPIAGTVLSQIELVLTSKPDYNKLTNPEKVSLRNRILLASQHSGSVNGVRALLIAKNWKSGLDNSQEGLQKLVYGPTAHPLCASGWQECDKPVCADLESCMANNSVRMKVCPNIEALQFKKHIGLTLNHGDASTALEWMPQVAASTQIPREQKQYYFRKVWEKQIRDSAKKLTLLDNLNVDSLNDYDKWAIKYNLDANVAIKIAPAAIRSYEGRPDKSKKAQEIADLVLNSPSFSGLIYKSGLENWVTQDKVQEMKELLKAVNDVDPSAFAKVIEDWTKPDRGYFIAFTNFRFGTSVSEGKLGELVWGLNQLREDPAFVRHKALLDKKINSLLKSLDNRNALVGDATYSLVSPAMDKNKAEILERAKRYTKTDQIENLGNAEARYVVANLGEMGDQANQFAIQILERADAQKGWGDNDLALAIHTLGKSVELSDKPNKDSEQLKKTIEQLIEKSQDPFVLNSLFHNSTALRTLASSAENVEKAEATLPLIKTFLNRETSGLLSKRVAQAHMADKIQLGPDERVGLVKDLILLPDTYGASTIAPVKGSVRNTKASGQSGSIPIRWQTKSNHDLADQMVASMISDAHSAVERMIQKDAEIKALDKAKDPNSGLRALTLTMANIREAQTYRLRLAEFEALEKTLDKDIRNKQKWPKINEAIEKYRNDVRTNGYGVQGWPRQFLRKLDNGGEGGSSTGSGGGGGGSGGLDNTDPAG